MLANLKMAWLGGFVLLALPWGTAQAEIPPLSPKMKNAAAKWIVTGVVKDIRAEDRKMGRGKIDTDYDVEIAIQTVEKGKKLKEGDMVKAHGWSAKKRPQGNTGPSGHYIKGGTVSRPLDLPVGAKVRVFLEGDPKGGYDIVFPNGVEVLEMAPIEVKLVMPLADDDDLPVGLDEEPILPAPPKVKKNKWKKDRTPFARGHHRDRRGSFKKVMPYADEASWKSDRNKRKQSCPYLARGVRRDCKEVTALQVERVTKTFQQMGYKVGKVAAAELMAWKPGTQAMVEVTMSKGRIWFATDRPCPAGDCGGCACPSEPVKVAVKGGSKRAVTRGLDRLFAKANTPAYFNRNPALEYTPLPFLPEDLDDLIPEPAPFSFSVLAPKSN